MSYYLDCQCETCLKREGESLGRNIVIHSIILNGMPDNVVTHADYRALEEELAALRLNNALLGELLAVIHGDGGHYQAEHGGKKAVEDAIAIFHKNKGLREAHEDLKGTVMRLRFGLAQAMK